jgi:hypothetical protein
MANRYGLRIPQRREWWAVQETSTGAECSRHLSAEAAVEMCERLQQLARERGNQRVKVIEVAGVDHLWSFILW